MRIEITGIHSESLVEAERAVLVRALQEASGDIDIAANLLDLGRSTMYRKVAQHEISDEERYK